MLVRFLGLYHCSFLFIIIITVCYSAYYAYCCARPLVVVCLYGIWPGSPVSRSWMNNNNNRRLVTLAEHTSDHGRHWMNGLL